jgi:hypothetical protein
MSKVLSQVINVIAFFLFTVSPYQPLTGQPPSNLKWYSIKTPHYRIVFHDGLQDKALETAAIMDYVWEKVPDVYPVQPAPISLYLNSLTSTSNAFVALGPRHMHYYMHPPQNANMLGSADWTKLLAVHEFRHVTQFDFLDRNLFSIFSALFGDLGRSVPALLFVPMWYYEGDAISSETAFTAHGRGRLPEFEMPLKAILTGTDQKFSYNQASLLSYRRFFPDHYHLGYFMHTHVSRKYGTETWPGVIDQVTRGKFFSRGLKKHTGMPSRKIYRETMNELTELWRSQVKPLPEHITPLPARDATGYTSYRHGYQMADGSLVSVKYGLGHAPMIIRTPDIGMEEFLRGLNNDIRISSNGEKIAWGSSTPHVRWDMQDFSDIMVMDAATSKARKVTSGLKYVSPALSPDGNWIAAVNYRENLQYSLDIFAVENTEILYSLPMEGGQIPRTPAWSADGKQVVFTVSGNEASYIRVLDRETLQVQEFAADPTENVASPAISNEYIYFISSALGNNDVHAIHRLSGHRFVALSGGYGFFNPTLNYSTGEFIIESYTPAGYRLYTWQPDPATFVPFTRHESKEHYIDPVLADGTRQDLFQNYTPDTTPYSIKRFRHFPRGLKLHSWYFLPELQGVSGTALMSDPLALHNFSGTVGYNQNEGTSYQSLDYSFRGLFPVLGLSILNGTRTLYSSTDSTHYSWNEQSLKVGAGLPLNFSREDFTHTLTLESDMNYTLVNGLDYRYKEEYNRGNGTFTWAQTGLSWLSHKMLAPRDFYPSLGFQLDASYRSTMGSSDYTGSMTSLSATAFLPGLARHHSLRLHGTWEQQEPDFNPDRGYIFPSEVLFFRGYEPIFHLETAKFSADYSFPIGYPDFGLGGFVYCKRIRGNLFVDYGTGQTLGLAQTFTSYGMDLLFDLHFFRFPAEIDLGIRLVNTTEQSYKPEFIFFQRF